MAQSDRMETAAVLIALFAVCFCWIFFYARRQAQSKKIDQETLGGTKVTSDDSGLLYSDKWLDEEKPTQKDGARKDAAEGDRM